MKLTLDIFDYLLRRIYDTQHSGTWHGAMEISRVIMGEPESPAENILYVLICHEIWEGQDTAAGRVCLRLVGEEFRELLKDRKGYFIFCGEGEQERAANAILNLYIEYREWIYQTERAALHEHSTEHMLDLAAQFLKANLSLVDSDYHIQNYAFFPQYIPDGIVNERGAMTVPSVQDLYIDNPAFDETFRERGLIFYPYYSSRQGFRLYYYNIFYHDTCQCRLLAEVEETEQLSALQQLLEYLCSHLERCYIHNYKKAFRNPSEQAFRACLSAAAIGKSFVRTEAAKALQGIGWNSRDEFSVIKLQPNGYGNSSQTLKFFCTQFEDTFSNCYTAENGKVIYAICNLSMQADRNRYKKEMPVFLRENLLQAGISCTFHDFFDLDSYIREADLALMLGQKKNPSFWLHEFGNYRFDYIINKLTDELPVQDLCHQALSILKAHDQTRPDTELCRTLYEYMKCRFNAVQAAEKLHIHRTTFFYRLRRIQELANIDFDDWNERLLLLLSFAIGYENGENRKNR